MIILPDTMVIYKTATLEILHLPHDLGLLFILHNSTPSCLNVGLILNELLVLLSSIAINMALKFWQ